MALETAESKILEKFKVKRSVVSRSIQGEEVLMDLDSGMYFGLNDIGTRLWNGLKSDMSTEVFIEQVQDEFDVDRETILSDAHLLLKNLLKKQLITEIKIS